MSYAFTFIDLFAGIGGFHLAAHQNGGGCVYASEIDKFARQTYEHNFKDISPVLFRANLFDGDITLGSPEYNNIPDFDLLLGGFPCQAFSNIGLREGFNTARGTLFFNIAEIVKSKLDQGSPAKVLLLENVKGLMNHDKGNTLRVILETLDDLGYQVAVDVLNSRHFGLPQNRERVFIVAWHKELVAADSFIFPQGLDESGSILWSKKSLKDNVVKTSLDRILFSDEELHALELAEKKDYTVLEGTWLFLNAHRERNSSKGNGFGYVQLDRNAEYTGAFLAHYYKDGREILINQEHLGKRPRKLHPLEAARLQGFPVDSGYRFPVSNGQAYKQIGNSISIPVVSAIIKQIKDTLLK